MKSILKRIPWAGIGLCILTVLVALAWGAVDIQYQKGQEAIKILEEMERSEGIAKAKEANQKQ